jgi:hypothetical protein
MYLSYEQMLGNVYLSSRELGLSNFKKDVPERNFVCLGIIRLLLMLKTELA